MIYRHTLYHRCVSFRQHAVCEGMPGITVSLLCNTSDPGCHEQYIFLLSFVRVQGDTIISCSSCCHRKDGVPAFSRCCRFWMVGHTFLAGLVDKQRPTPCAGRCRVPAYSTLTDLRRVFSCFGKVSSSTPFVKLACAFSSSTADGRGRVRMYSPLLISRR